MGAGIQTLSSSATFRTRRRMWDIPFARLRVRRISPCFVFSISPPLPSTASAHGLSSPYLFGGFFGTLSRSDSSQSYMYGLRLRLPVPPTCLHQTEGNCEVSRLPLRKFPYMPGSQTARGSDATRNTAAFDVAFHFTDSVGPPGLTDFRRSMAGLHVPLSTLRRQPHGCRRMPRGHRGLLLLRCGDSSSPAL